MATATTTTEAEKRKAAAKKAAATRKRNQAEAAKKREAAAKKAAATRKRNAAQAEREKVSPQRPSLTEREPKVLAEDASYAAAGLAVEAVSLVRNASTKLEQLRAEVQKAAADPAATVRNVSEQGPATVTRTATELRDRLVGELESAIATFEDQFDARATEGRKLVESLKRNDRVAKLLEQSENSRSQVKAALTSVTKTFDVAVGAGRKQAETAASQVKAAATSVRKSAERVPDAAEATVDEVDAAS